MNVQFKCTLIFRQIHVETEKIIYICYLKGADLVVTNGGLLAPKHSSKLGFAGIYYTQSNMKKNVNY